MRENHSGAAVARKDTSAPARPHPGSPKAAPSGPRICADETCTTRLSRYNRDDYCTVHNDTTYEAGEFPLLRTRGRNGDGARIEDVQRLLEEARRAGRLDHGDTMFAQSIGMDPRQLHGIVSGKGTRSGKPPRMVSAGVIDKLLTGLGWEQERRRWSCLA